MLLLEGAGAPKGAGFATVTVVFYRRRERFRSPGVRKVIVFGPIPSRRLGRSLGVNNIPPKICSYSCLYCQVGKTRSFSVDRKEFYPVEKILEEVANRVEEVSSAGERIDYITFVPDGEPTLDVNLGREIETLKAETGHPIAVITNASLIWMKEVRAQLGMADLVSIKVDAVSEKLWRRINRPLKQMAIEKILEGQVEFARDYSGKLITETMVIDGINDFKGELEGVAFHVSVVQPDVAYISVPTRPPAESSVSPPCEKKIVMAREIFRSKGIRVELLTGREKGHFTVASNFEDAILSILSVHPMRKGSIEQLLTKNGRSWQLIESLIDSGKVVEKVYNGEKFYVRKL